VTKLLEFSNWRVRSKIMSISAITLALMLLTILFYFLPAVQTRIVDAKEEELRDMVDMCLGLIAEYDARAKAGEFSLEEARKRAAERAAHLRYGKEGYLWINDMQPKMIMHPTEPALNGKDLSDYKDPDGKALFVEFVQVCKEKGGGFVAYRWPKPGAADPLPKVSYVKGYEPWGWVVGTGVYTDGIAAEMSRLRWEIMIAFGLFAFMIAAIATPVARRITRPLEKMGESVERMARGDLSASFENIDTNDEVGTLARSMDRMVVSFNEMIEGIIVSSNGVASTVDGMIPKVSRTTRGAQDQSTQASAIATAAEEMSQTIGEIARSAQAASTTSTEAMKTAEEGKRVTDEAIATIDTVGEATAHLSSMVGRLNGKAEEIGNIVTVINDIADQTNLLALNAAIEAARAGEHGRGFAVVADEVRKLAEKTISSTSEISEKVKAVQQESDLTNQSMESALKKVTEATTYVKRAGSSLAHIVEDVQRTRDEITQMATAVEEQLATSEEIARNIEGTTVIARGIETSSGEVLNSVAGLTDIAAKLNVSVSGFRTRSGGIVMFDIARNDHRTFVHRLGAFLSGRINLELSDLPDHHGCRFGKWYDTKGKEYGSLKSMQEIALPHEKIHELGKGIVNACTSGNRTEAERLFAELGQVSQRIAGLLEKAKEEARTSV
jgi:methyl-accepting chemotaxis protein